MGETKTRLGKVMPANWIGENSFELFADTEPSFRSKTPFRAFRSIRGHRLCGLGLEMRRAPGKSQLRVSAHPPRPMTAFLWNTERLFGVPP